MEGLVQLILEKTKKKKNFVLLCSLFITLAILNRITKVFPESFNIENPFIDNWETNERLNVELYISFMLKLSYAALRHLRYDSILTKHIYLIYIYYIRRMATFTSCHGVIIYLLMT